MDTLEKYKAYIEDLYNVKSSLNTIIKSVTISQTATGKYQISILVEYEAEIKPVTPTVEAIIGLDYSSPSLFVDSEANSADYPKFYRQAEGKLKREQRKLSKRLKGSKNRDKQRLGRFGKGPSLVLFLRAGRGVS